jgi:hypothetical protein
MRSTDVGLRKFLGLFEDLGGVEEEEALALAYVGLTGHLTKAITFTEAVEHLTQLNNALYHIGALRPDIKESIDDHLNNRAMKETVEEIDKEIASEDVEIPEPEQQSDPVEVVEVESTSKDEVEEDDELHDMILHASVETSATNETSDISSEPEMNITGADVVTARTRKQKKKIQDTQQLSLLDEIELAESKGDSEEERGSASV